MAQCPAQPEQGLTQVLLGLGLEMRAPEQGCQLLPRLRLGRGAGQIGQQAASFLLGSSTGPSRPGQLEAGQQRKPEFREQQRHSSRRLRDIGAGRSAGPAILHFYRTTARFNAAVTRH